MTVGVTPFHEGIVLIGSAHTFKFISSLVHTEPHPSKDKKRSGSSFSIEQRLTIIVATKKEFLRSPNCVDGRVKLACTKGVM